MDTITEQLASALSAHAKWKSRLRDAIDRGQSDASVATVARDDQRPFGKWLYGEGAAESGRTPHYAACKEAHAQLHVAAADVLELALGGKRADAEHKLAPSGEFARASAVVSREILAWQKERRGSVPGSGHGDQRSSVCARL